MIKRLGPVLGFLLFCCSAVQAQTVIYYKQAVGLNPIAVSVANPLPVTGSISASLAGFTPSGNYASPLSVSNSSTNVALPTNTGTVAVYNVGATAAYCVLGTSNAVTATTSDDYIPAGGAAGYTVGSNTYVACITASSTTTVNVSGGAGLFTNFGSGATGSSSNASVSATGSAVPASATYLGIISGGNLVGWTGAVTATLQASATTAIGKVDPNTIATWGLAPIGGTSSSPTNALGAGCEFLSSPPTYTTGNTGIVQCTAAGSVHTVVDNANANGAASIGNSSPVTAATINVTPTDCSIALTTGGTAQNIIAANAALHGFTIANIDPTNGSGEPVWMSFTGAAVAGAVGSYPLAAPTATTFAGLSSYTTPLGFGVNHAISVIAVTTNHKISCTYW